MEPFEMAWNLGTIIVALVFAEWFFIRRSTKKAIKVIREEFPILAKVSALLKEPVFIDVICDTLDTLDTINKTVQTCKAIIREISPAFLAPEFYESFIKQKPKEVVESGK